MNAFPLVLVPGLMCDHTVWEPLLPLLPAAKSFHIVDHKLANSLTLMATQLLDQAPDQFVVAGHSMGGRVVLEALRLAPERIAGVALMDTGHLPKLSGTAGEEEVRKRLALLGIAQAQGVRAMAHEWVKGMVHPDRLKDAALIEQILSMFERKSSDVFARQLLALIHRPDGTEVLKSIKVPTLMLCGEQDAWSPPAQHEAMKVHVPGAAMAVIPNAGHMSTMEKPEAVAQAMQNWLLACA